MKSVKQADLQYEQTCLFF